MTVAVVRCECDLLPAECLCARMREQVPRKCPLTYAVRHVWLQWAMARLRVNSAAMWERSGPRSWPGDRSRYADEVRAWRALGRRMGQAIAYEIAREHPMDRVHREIDDGLHDVMCKLEAM